MRLRLIYINFCPRPCIRFGVQLCVCNFWHSCWHSNRRVDTSSDDDRRCCQKSKPLGEITLPDDSELIYHKYWQGFPGENATYNIIGFETQPSQLIADFSDNPDQPCDGQRSFEENVSACFNSFIVEVPEAEEFIPDLTCDYVWKYLEKENSQSEMFFLYYPNDVVLYTFKYVM